MSYISPKPEQSTDEEVDVLTSLTDLANSGSGQFLRKVGGVFVNDTPAGAISVDESELVHNLLSGLTTGDPHTQYAVLTPTTSTRNIITPTADRIGLSVRPFSSQTADIWRVENNVGTLQHLYTDKDGHTHIGKSATYTTGGQQYADSYRLYFDAIGGGSLRTSYIQVTPFNAGVAGEVKMSFIANNTTFFSIGDPSGAVVFNGGIQTGSTAWLIQGTGMRTNNGAAGSIRGEFNTITIQGEKNTASDYDVKIVGKNPFGGATASRIVGFFSDSTVQSYIQPGGGLILNEQGADSDSRFEGDTDANLFFLDASTDRIGIGTATPGYKFDVSGDINASGVYRSGGTAGVSGTFTTADAKTVTVAGGIIVSIV